MGVLADWQIERDVSITPFQPAAKRAGQISSGLSAYGYDCRLGYKFKVFKPYPCMVIDPKAFDERMLEDVDLSLPLWWPTPEPPPDADKNHTWHGPNGQEWEYYGNDGWLPIGEEGVIERKPDHILIPPHSFVLAESLERFKIPRDVLCVVLGKSTYARCGLIVNVTPLEPEWEGVVTIELSNTTPLPMKVYPGEGIMQCLFFRSDGWRKWIWNKFRAVWWAVTSKGEDPTPHAVSCKQSYADKKGKYRSQGGLTIPKVDKKSDLVPLFPYCVCKCGNTVKVLPGQIFGHHQSKPATYCLHSGLPITDEYLKEQGVNAKGQN